MWNEGVSNVIDAIDVIEQQQQKGYVSWRRRIAMIIAERERERALSFNNPLSTYNFA